MNIESNVSKISEQMTFYQTLSVVLLALAVIFTIAAIVVWFVLKIPHSFKVLTGIGAGRELQKIKSDTKAGLANKSVTDNKAVLNWTTSSFSNPASAEVVPPKGFEETQLLTDVYDGSEETQLLSEVISDTEETQLLSDIEDRASESPAINIDFEVEEEIKITGSNESL